MFPILSCPTVVCGGGCGRERRKYKEPSSTRRKGKRIGRFPKLPSEILPGGKTALPPPGRPGLRAFLSSLLGSGGWGLRGPSISLGLSLPTSTTKKTSQAFPQSQLLQLPRETGRGARPRQGAPKAHRLRNRQSSQGTAHAPLGPPRIGRPVLSQTGSPRHSLL